MNLNQPATCNLQKIPAALEPSSSQLPLLGYLLIDRPPPLHLFPQARPTKRCYDAAITTETMEPCPKFNKVAPCTCCTVQYFFGGYNKHVIGENFKRRFPKSDPPGTADFSWRRMFVIIYYNPVSSITRMI